MNNVGLINNLKPGKESVMKLKIIDIAHHRNGVGGAPFDIVLFKDSGTEGSRKVAILFDEKYHCAVLDVAKLEAGDIAFMTNSWRGDQYEPYLRSEIDVYLRSAIDASPPKEQPEINIHELLAERQQIALVWSIADVQQLRPDLDDEQAWEVLEHVDDNKDAGLGINWLTLEMAAGELFGAASEADEAEEE
jgi:hypothetical protein